VAGATAGRYTGEMARQRSHATQLGKLLDSAPQPIYVLDDDLTIVFVNHACRDWLGPAADELLGRRCVYGSGPQLTGPDAVAAGLCPPPTITQGSPLVAGVARLAEHRAVFRRASFIPLVASDAVIGVIAVVGAEDCPEETIVHPAPQPPQDHDPAALHELVLRFRRQMTLRHDIDRLLGTSPAIRRARAQAELAVGSRASVLLVGPKGSGRQHVAAAIHYGGSPDAAGMLVPLACSVLGPELIQSTVRALVSGGTLAKHPGRNTLLLNEADQLPSEVQCELLGVLSARNLPLRLIAAAEQPLADLARRGRYREDLAAFLSTITIELPPLAQRREDLPMLTQAFLEEANARRGKQLSGFTSAAMDRLDAYAWPGNLDELALAVAESHQRAAGREITPEDLPEKLRLAAEAAAHPRRKEETIVLDEFLQRIERELIRRAVARSKGNRAKAARLLGFSRPRLARRMTQLGLAEGGETERGT
jgi:transcriptional regulator with PAS, ATPase and Fis domain